MNTLLLLASMVPGSNLKESDAEVALRVRVAIALATYTSQSVAPVPQAKPIVDPLTPAQRLKLVVEAAREETYLELLDRAAAEKKPLVVWVRHYSSDCEAELQEAYHIQMSAFPGFVRGVVVGIPSSGKMLRVDLPGAPTFQAIRAAIRDRLAPGIERPGYQQQSAPSRPVSRPPGRGG